MSDSDAKPLTGRQRQLDILARQLLGVRSGLEASRAQIAAQLDQLDGAFALLSALQMDADTNAAAAQIETPGPAGPDMAPPPTFGHKARERAAAGAPSTRTLEGSTDGNTP